MIARVREDPKTPPTWKAPRGTQHRFCGGCERWFASRGTSRCPTCIATGGAQSASPFFAGGSTGRRYGVKD